MNLLGTCRFYPTCSRYSLQAFERHGFLKAVRLTIWRLLRCHPFASGGYDPLLNCHCEKPAGDEAI